MNADLARAGGAMIALVISDDESRCAMARMGAMVPEYPRARCRRGEGFLNCVGGGSTIPSMKRGGG
jgi:hypothetical protein